jgi:hypothetical protein
MLTYVARTRRRSRARRDDDVVKDPLLVYPAEHVPPSPLVVAHDHRRHWDTISGMSSPTFTQRNAATGAKTVLTSVDDRQLLEEVVGVAVIVVDQQCPHRRLLRLRVLPLRPPRRETPRGMDPQSVRGGGSGARRLGRQKGPSCRRRRGEAERGHRGCARAGSGRKRKRKGSSFFWGGGSFWAWRV